MNAETTGKFAVTPDFGAAADAIAQATGAQNEADVAAALGVLAKGLGMERYCLLDVAGDLGGEVAALYHDTPTDLRAERTDLAAMNTDPVFQLARARAPLPFTWGPDLPLYAGSFYARHADLGYRSGIAATSLDHTGSAAIVVLSSSEDRVPESLAVSMLGLGATFTASLIGRLAKMRPPPAACPLAQRERECVLCVLAGLSTKQMARHLGIGARTIGQYLERARVKLGASTSFAAGVIALRRGWIDMSEVSALADAVTPRSSSRP